MIKKRYISILLGSIVYAFPVYGEVFQFIFISPPHVVSPDTISKAVSIQSVNKLGVPEEVFETVDIVFTTTSMTGEFVNSVGKKASITMAKNTARRNVHYRDSQKGKYTITMNATGRISHTRYSAQQDIFVDGLENTSHINISTVSTSTGDIKIDAKNSNVNKKVEAFSVNDSQKKEIQSESKKVSEPKKKEIENKQEEEQSVQGHTHSAEQNVATVYKGITEESFFDTLFFIPVKLWNVIVGIFT